jgi:hypothetical protein
MFSWATSKRRPWLALGICAVLALAIGWDLSLFYKHEETFAELPPYDFDAPRYLLPLPPTTEFPTRTVRAAWDALTPDELVLGVRIDGAARAYPLNVLNLTPAYKVLNDVLGGKPVAATFCDNCHNGIVYLREVDGRTLTFGVDGRLWKESMVLYDQETNSRWSHMTGVAKIGRLQGKTLTPLPSVMTDWQTWRRQHPQGTVVVVPNTGREFVRGFYADRKEFVFGVADAGHARDWNLDDLTRSPVVNDEWQGTPVLVVLDRDSVTVRLFSRKLAGRTLIFREAKGELLDEETASAWEPTSGKSLRGALAGQSLEAIPGGMLSKRDAWRLHHPESR